MCEAVQKYAKECVNEKQAANVKNIMEDTGFTVKQALDEADWQAEEQSNNSFYTSWNRRKSHRRIYARYRSQGNWL